MLRSSVPKSARVTRDRLRPPSSRTVLIAASITRPILSALLKPVFFETSVTKPPLFMESSLQHRRGCSRTYRTPAERVNRTRVAWRRFRFCDALVRPRLPEGPPVDSGGEPWAWCNGSTTGSGPVSRGSNPCAPAPPSRANPRRIRPRGLQTQTHEQPDEHHRETHPKRPASVRLRCVTRRLHAVSAWVSRTPMRIVPVRIMSELAREELERDPTPPHADVGGHRSGSSRSRTLDSTARRTRSSVGPSPWQIDRLSVQEPVDHPGVDVGGSADRGGVPQGIGHLPDHGGDHAFA